MHSDWSGEDAAKIRASMGWADEMAQENYTHWNPEHFAAQREIIESLLKRQDDPDKTQLATKRLFD